MDGACSKQAQDKTATNADEQGPQQSKRAVRLCDSGGDFIPWLQCPYVQNGTNPEVRSPVTQVTCDRLQRRRRGCGIHWLSAREVVAQFSPDQCLQAAAALSGINNTLTVTWLSCLVGKKNVAESSGVGAVIAGGREDRAE
jgi:hypothetical protein